MGCYCYVRHGGAGRMNTPYTYHLYICEFYLDELENYTYEDFVNEYKKLENNTSITEINEYFWNKQVDIDITNLCVHMLNLCISD